MITTLALLLAGCGSTKGPDLTPDANRKTIKNVPDWFMNTPKKEGFKYHSATATSQDLQMAIDKAALNQIRVRFLLGHVLQVHSFQNPSVQQEQIISQSLKDYSIAEKEIQEERSKNDYIYRAYVLICFN